MSPVSSYVVFSAQGGYGAIAWTEAGVVQLQLPMSDATEAERQLTKRSPCSQPGSPTPQIASLVASIQRYFEGERIDFSSVRVDLRNHEDFFVRLYLKLQQIPWGQTTTYGELAKAIGAGSESARAVGAAMAKNPIPLIIPCHRVLAAGGKIGGFSAPGGVTTKQKMLQLEGIRVGPAESPQQSLEL
jgi:methylated-DNA-[protein]-cysteine S-methyltransferase